MRGGVEHFKITSVWTVNGFERVQTASCGGCGKTATIHDAGHAPKPVSMMAQKFRQKGWRIASRPTGDRCPACNRATTSQARAKPDLSPAQRRAAFCRIAGVAPAAPVPPSEKPKEAKMTKPALVAAEPPREATREDRRRVRDALDAHYLIDKACYAKGGSDRSLAEQLKVPRAWVSEERERAYGPDACEADGQDLERLKVLEVTAKGLLDRGLELAADAERLGRDIAGIRAGLAKRGAA